MIVFAATPNLSSAAVNPPFALSDVPASIPLFNPLLPLQGVLPNGQSFVWQLMDATHIPAVLQLQDQVATAANDIEKNFLIKRSANCFASSLAEGHLYWAAFVGNQIVALFGLADNDEEVGDGRGEKTPKDALGVDDYTHVSILKGAQVDPLYRDQGLGGLGALSRYLYFLANPDKRVIMTKIHAANVAVANNYLNNGFVEACRTAVTDHEHTFNLITYKAERELVQSWVDEKITGVVTRFNLLLV